MKKHNVFGLILLMIVGSIFFSCTFGEDLSFDPVSESFSLVPEGLKASDGLYSDRIQLSWDVLNNVKKYEIYRKAEGGVETKIDDSTSNTYNDLYADPGTIFHYRIKAVMETDITTGFSSGDTGYKKLATPQITSISSTYSDRVEIVWNAVEGADTYTIYRGTTQTGTFNELADVTVTTYTDRSTDIDVTYYYKLKAVSAIVGESNICNPSSGKCVSSVESKPEIGIRQDTTVITSGVTTITFGEVAIDATANLAFTIENTGNVDLVLSGVPDAIVLSGTDAAHFSLTQSGQTTISAKNAVQFTITFAPTSFGLKTALITIPNNDNDENPFTFSIEGGRDLPVMQLYQDATPIPTGGDYDFGSVNTGEYQDTTFTIKNEGTLNLSLTGNPIVQLTGDTTNFTLLSQPALTTITPAGSTTFIIRFAPLTDGNKAASISITNNDQDQTPYTFSITGGGNTPEIAVLDNTTDIPDDTGTVDFGSYQLGASTTMDFTIENTGIAPLLLTGTPLVQIGGTDAALFSVTATPAMIINADQSTTFTIEFSADSYGDKTATVSIANNDLNEESFDFTITATVLTPEIRIMYEATNITSGTTINPAGCQYESTHDYTFTIYNDDQGYLELSGSPLVSITGTDASLYTVTATPGTIITDGASTTFTIQFTASSYGDKTATVTIANNDTDEANFTFTITTTVFTPEIRIMHEATNITSGTNVSPAGCQYGTTQNNTFTIHNDDQGYLTLTGSPLVAISGSDASLYTVTATPDTTIADGASTTFTIQFSATSYGDKTANVTIANNDNDEASFTFTITTTVLAPEIDMEHNAESFSSGALLTPEYCRYDTTKDYDFTISNNGPGYLYLTGSPLVTISGSDAYMFSLITAPDTTIDTSGQTTFTIRMNGSDPGVKTVTLTVENNDLNESVYTINLSISVIVITGEFEISYEGTAINVSDVVVLDPCYVSQTMSYDFTIGNAVDADATLDLTGSPLVDISGTDNTLFTVTAQPATSITIGDTTTFTIQIDGSTSGTKTVDLTIPNNDYDEGSFMFTVNVPVINPEITIKEGTTTIAADTTYDIGDTLVDQPLQMDFTVKNDGDTDLILTGSPKVSLSGTDAAYFSIEQQPGTTIESGSSSNFTLQLIPNTDRVFTALVTIASNDYDEPTFTYAVTGEGTRGIYNTTVTSTDYTFDFKNPIEYDSKVFFQAVTSSYLSRPFYYDTSIKDVAINGSSTYYQTFENPIEFNSMIFFEGENNTPIDLLYCYNSSQIVDVAVNAGSDYGSKFLNPIVYGSNLFFRAQNTTAQYEFYMHDGTDIKNVASGGDFDKDFEYPIIYNGLMYFQGMNGSGGDKIYQMNGTTITNVTVDSGSDYYYAFVNPIEYNGNLYFQGETITHVTKIYKFDGTKIYSTDGSNHTFTNPIIYDGNVYFKDVDNVIKQFNGSTVSAVTVGTGCLYVNNFMRGIVFNNKLYFYGDGAGVSFMFEYDGTQINNMNTGSSNYYSKFEYPIIYQGNLYFQGAIITNSQYIYKFDGSVINNVSAGSSNYEQFFAFPIIFNDKLYFLGYGNSTLLLYCYY